MSDADQQRQARSLGEIAHHLGQLVKIHKILNENVTIFIRDMRELAATFNIPSIDPGQLTIGGVPVKFDESMPPSKWKIEPTIDPKEFRYRDPIVEDILGEREVIRQRPDVVDDEKKPDGKE
jgi:hypothetical protein